MNDPILSVMITAYNQDGFIAEAIESVLNQKTTYTFEIIIGEDCSNDNTLKICTDYEKKYPDKIKVVRNKQNLGILGNWESTFSHCKGKYFSICEGDDYWTDEKKIDKQIDFLEKNPEFGMVCSNYSKVYQTTGIKEENCLRNRRFQKIIKYSDYIIVRNSIMTATVVMKSELYRKYINSVPFEIRHKWPRTPDVPLFLYISHESKVGVLTSSTAEYRILDVSGCRFDDEYLQYEYIIKGYEIPIYFASVLFNDQKLLRKVKKARLNYALNFWFYKKNLQKIENEYHRLGLKEGVSSYRYNIYKYVINHRYIHKVFKILLDKWKEFRIKYIRL